MRFLLSMLLYAVMTVTHTQVGNCIRTDTTICLAGDPTSCQTFTSVECYTDVAPLEETGGGY